MSPPIRLRSTLALLAGIALAAIALAQSIAADLHVPAALILAAECQGFEALATVGGTPLTCDSARVAEVERHGTRAVPAAVSVAAIASTAPRKV